MTTFHTPTSPRYGNETAWPSTQANGVALLSRAGSPYERYCKPVFDRVVGLVLLAFLSPAIALVALALLATLGRPLIIRQRRIGRDGVVFSMYKFRTMQPDRRVSPPKTAVEEERRRRHKSPDDPRHTDVGRVLRRYSLDELPQLWNVVRGDMSLVGPRPELEQVVSSYAAWQHQRHQVRPGLTGLWQVTKRGTSDGDMHLHTDVDLEYLERVSLVTDLGILLRTLPAAMGGRSGSA